MTTKVTLTCVTCKKDFQRFPSQVADNKTGTYFCSKACTVKVGSKPKTGVTVKCLQCDSMVYLRPHRAAAGKDSHCSRKCANITKTRQRDVTCVCGTVFSVHSKSTQTFCSKECAGNASTLVEKTCLNCNKYFTARPEYKFCGKPCFYDYQTANAKGHIAADGYVTISVNGVAMKEHRYVMEQTLSRKLLPGENVHHANKVRHDNRPENLRLWVTSQPSGAEASDLILWHIEQLAALLDTHPAWDTEHHTKQSVIDRLITLSVDIQTECEALND